MACVLLLACGNPGAKSKKSFDDIRGMVQGRTAAEVESLLGEPDSRMPVLGSGERWVWWNYTYLDEQDYPPEIRGRVVHLKIVFERSSDAAGNTEAGLSDLKVAGPLAVSYILPQKVM